MLCVSWHFYSSMVIVNCEIFTIRHRQFTINITLIIFKYRKPALFLHVLFYVIDKWQEGYPDGGSILNLLPAKLSLNIFKPWRFYKILL